MAGTYPAEDPSPQDRVVAELAALKDRATALSHYIEKGCPGAAPHHRTLLAVQLGHMLAYATVLRARLLNWDE